MREREGAPADASPFYEAATTSSQATDPMRIHLVKLCIASADFVCARKALDALTADSAATRDANWLRAQVEFGAKNWKEASDLLAELLKTDADKNNLDFLRMAIEARLKLDDTAGAIQLLETAITIAPTDKDLRYHLARIYSNSTAPDQLQRAVELLKG